jgi:Protein of unknown function (DUF3616)
MTAGRQVELRFAASGGSDDALKDLSAICSDGPWLWIAGDEAPRVERLRASEDGAYDEHLSFLLGDLVDLPEGRDEEVDVEGMDRTRDHLWLVGSHSRTRKRVDDKDDDAEAVANLRTVRSRPNRHVLIRLPIDDGEPRQGALLGSVGGLSDVLSTDEHLAPFLTVPSKDNGLDVEGLAVIDDGAVLVGLRGPVLRGWAVVLELALDDVPERPDRLALRDCTKYFLRLDGLGVRDLCRDGDDLLVLAGPTMDLDGPTRLYRWHGAVQERKLPVVRGEQLTRLDVPLPLRPDGTAPEDGRDKAEGITLLSGAAEPSVLVVYDTPADARRGDDGRTVLADVVPLPR